MKLIKTSPTAPIQAVTETTLESNSNINAPTIKAVVDSLYRPNLLVNGDFQCWQRGENITTSGTKTEYFADMWCSTYTSTFTKVVNGIKTSKLAHIFQLLPKLEMGRKYTIVLSINNIIYKETFTGGTFKENDKFYYSVSRETSEKGNLSMIVIKLSANDILNYADLFEGSIAYPHIEEDYAVALMRCMEYVQVCYPYNNLNKFWGDSRGSVLSCTYPLKANIRKNSTITGGSNIWLYSNDTATNYDDLVNYTIQVRDGNLEIRFTKKDKSIFTESNYSMSYQGKFIISSEPL